MHHRTIWSLLIIGLVLLISALLTIDVIAFEPYLQYKAFINRRTGKFTQYKIYCDHFAKRYHANIQPFWADISPYGSLTASDIDVPVSTVIFKQHIWSADKMFGDELPRNELGHRLMKVFGTLFGDLVQSSLPLAQTQELYRQRIAIWNSDFPDHATSNDIEKLNAENARIFPEHVR